MKIEEMIEEMNKAIDGTLSIIHYQSGWELHSYKKGSLFSSSDNYIYAETFRGVVEEAYKVLKREELPEEEQDITKKVI